MIYTILFALAANPAFASAGILVTFIQSGMSIIGWLKKNSALRKTPDSLLGNIFCAVAYKTLRPRIQNESWLGSIQFHSRKQTIPQISSFNFSEYLVTALDEREELVQVSFAILFGQLKHKLKEMNLHGCTDAALTVIFDGIENEAVQLWNESLRDAKLEFPQLAQEMADQDEKSISSQIDGATVPMTRSGAHMFLLARGVKGDYWAQNIEFSHTAMGDIDAVPDSCHLQTLPARPCNENKDAWWSELAVRLSDAPIFLTAPGGMGKSAFLVYLYENINRLNPACPFEGAFLLSLDLLMAQAACKLGSGNGIQDPDESILLRCIASCSENQSRCRSWKNILSGKTEFIGNRPILLLLDGFSEMRARKVGQLNRYSTIMEEIITLSNKNDYPNVRLIITSRADIDRQVTEQKEELPSCFQHAVLGGISEVCEMPNILNEEMQMLLKRPMYYCHFKKSIDQNKMPTSQYEALREMYASLTKQSVINPRKPKRAEKNYYIMKYLLPVIAYHDWSDNSLTYDIIELCCTELVSWSPMIQHYHESCVSELESLRPEIKWDYDGIPHNIIRHFGRKATKITAYLAKQEQILSYKDGTYRFLHQDYRDYLVAQYFLQRMYFMEASPNSPIWNRQDFLNSLRLNTYARDILLLIYQALSFSKVPKEGEPTAFVQKFHTTKEDLTAGLILWYTTAYQLADMKTLVGVVYGGTNLNADTLKILEPLIRYVCKKPLNIENQQPLSKLPEILKQHLIEILMKACEIYRRNGNYVKAREITQAANFICPVKSKSNFNALMRSVIDHNDAVIDLCDFEKNNQCQLLKDALKKLQRCALSSSPYRYSASRLAMILVSPQPALAARMEYQKFVKKLVEKENAPPEAIAFRLYHQAIYDKRKEGESWLIKLYPLRQMLYLLADNKVQAGSDALTDDDRCVTVAKDRTPIPTRANLQLISKYLEKIKGIEVSWKHYMQGLICYIIEGDIACACEAFKKVGNRDVRAQLWLAYLRQHLTMA